MAPETVIIAASVVYAGIVLVMVRLTRHFAAPQPIPVTAEWLDELSIETTDLLRLLDKEGLQLLPTKPDFTPKSATKHHIQRCQLLQEHLPRLKSDFRLASMAVKVIMVQSGRDRPDLARVLVRSQITFAYRMMTVRFRLVCYRHGLGSWISLV
jgi:hypothetical protein